MSEIIDAVVRDAITRLEKSGRTNEELVFELGAKVTDLNDRYQYLKAQMRWAAKNGNTSIEDYESQVVSLHRGLEIARMVFKHFNKKHRRQKMQK